MKNLFLLLFLLVGTITMASPDKPTCGVTTKSGTPCKHIVASQGLKCWVHGGVATSKVATKQCIATTKSGKQCKNKTSDPSGKCHVHNR